MKSDKNPQRFVFHIEASKFFFGFYYKEFDQDLVISLQSVKLVDRSPDVIGDRGNVVTMADCSPEIDE